MIKPFKLIFIRHAPSEKVEGYFPENNPNALINELDIKKIGGKLPKDCIWYVSPLKRTIQTAKALEKYVPIRKLILEEQLVEQNFGDWSGKKVKDVWEKLKNEKNKHNFSFICPEVQPPNGESFLNQYKRISHWLDSLNFFETNSVVIVTHSGTIKAAISYILEIKPDNVIGIDISHLSLTTFQMLKKEDDKNRGSRFRLLCINQKINFFNS